jgi:hypothetical protein
MFITVYLLSSQMKLISYDRIVSGIALAVLRRIGYSKNSVRMLGLLWAQLEHHVETGFGVSDASYKSTTDKLLYGSDQGSCSSPIVWALLNQLLLMALHITVFRQR